MDGVEPTTSSVQSVSESDRWRVISSIPAVNLRTRSPSLVESISIRTRDVHTLTTSPTSCARL